MKKALMVVIALALVFSFTSTVYASSGDTSGDCGTGQAFGAHVSEHARDGMLGADHNPGMHQGFSSMLDQ